MGNGEERHGEHGEHLGRSEDDISQKVQWVSWSGRSGSNRRHSAWEADVLPLNYARRHGRHGNGLLRIPNSECAPCAHVRLRSSSPRTMASNGSWPVKGALGRIGEEQSPARRRLPAPTGRAAHDEAQRPAGAERCRRLVEAAPSDERDPSHAGVANSEAIVLGATTGSGRDYRPCARAASGDAGEAAGLRSERAARRIVGAVA